MVAAVIGFLASWLAAKALFEIPTRYSDVPLYRHYGEAMVDGRSPYRDQSIEYPPGALPFFALPAALTSSLSGFAWVLEALLAFCGVALVVATGTTLAALEAGKARTAGVLAFVAVTPLLLGRTMFERYDLWPTALLAVAIALHARRRTSLAGVAIGLGAAAKLFPAVVLPILIVSVWRRTGAQAAVKCLAAAATTFLVCVLPFVALAPNATADVFVRQLQRPLQIETLGASLLLAAHQAVGLPLGIVVSYGSINLGGGGPALASAILTVAGAGLILTSWIASGASLERTTLAAALAVTTLVAFGKVLSPQFVIWVLPVVVLVGGSSGVAAVALLGCAMVLTHVLFPSLFLGLVRFEAGPTWTLLARNLVLVGLVATIALALWVEYREERSPP